MLVIFFSHTILYELLFCFCFVVLLLTALNIKINLRTIFYEYGSLSDYDVINLRQFLFLWCSQKAKISVKTADEMDLEWDADYQEHLEIEIATVVPWLEKLSHNSISMWRKEVSQDKKQKWVFKDGQYPRYKRLVKMCATKLGSDHTVHLFGKLGRENGLEEFNELIKICIEKARETTDEEVSLQEIYKAYQLFKLVRESGFQIEEKTYGQFLMYLIDFEMFEEFFFFHELIREDNPDSLPRLTYYEMLLRVRVEDDNKLQELCLSVATEGDDERFYRRGKLLES